MKNFLLTTGRTSFRVEYYILDLFKLYLSVYPEDIPGAEGIGFDFSLDGVLKADLKNELTSRLLNLVSVFSGRFGSAVNISLGAVDIIDEKTANVTINVNSTSDDITIDLSNYNN